MDSKKRNIIIVGGVIALLFLIPQLQSYFYMAQLAGIDDELRARSHSLASELPTNTPPSKQTAQPEPISQATPLEVYSKTKGYQPAGPSKLELANQELAKLGKELDQVKYNHQDLLARINACVKKSEMLYRLECYDRLVHNDTHFEDKHRAWTLDRSISPIDDSFNIHLTLSAQQTVRAHGNRHIRPTVTVTCGSNPPLVALNAGQTLAQGYQYIIHRVGEKKAMGSHWRVDDRGETAMLVQGKMDFIRELIKANRLAVEYAREYHPTVTLTFDTNELNQMSNDLLKACSA